MSWSPVRSPVRCALAAGVASGLWSSSRQSARAPLAVARVASARLSRRAAAAAALYPPPLAWPPPAPPAPHHRRSGSESGARDNDTRSYVASGVTALGLALLAAERFNERRFFKAALTGNLEEIKKQVEAAAAEGGGAGRGADEEEGGGGAAADRRHSLGWTALMAAAANGQAGVVRELVRLGARPAARERYSGARTPDAARLREEEFAPALNPRASYLGWTALHYAALADCVASTRALLDAGADPAARDHAGRRPLHYAPEPSATRDLLLEAAARRQQEEAERAADERRRFPLERRLRERLVGQRGAIDAVAAAVRRKESGWADDDHPLVFLFLGGSGVGKTELAKQLAQYLHRDEPAAFIRLDMSEYQERHEVAKLIGAPPGYVGHEEGGQLTRALARRQDALVLFDEVDKAHPDVLTVLLQLFDEGRLTDGKGKLIECKNAIFVMTSNLASDEIAQHGLELRREAEAAAAARRAGTEHERAPTPHRAEEMGVGGGGGGGEAEGEERVEVSRAFKEQVVRPILKRHFKRDEFLGRINEIVYFLPFSRQELLVLVERELAVWAARADSRHGVELRWEEGALGALADGYDAHYGARSVQHEVERRVASRLALAAERGALPRGAGALLAERRGRLALLVRASPTAAFRPLDL